MDDIGFTARKELAKELTILLLRKKNFLLDDKCRFVRYGCILDFLVKNENAIIKRDIQSFDPNCIMNGCHQISHPIENLFDNNDMDHMWKLLKHLLDVYHPYHNLCHNKADEILKWLSQQQTT